MKLIAILTTLLALAGCRYGTGLGMSGIDIWKAVEEERIDLIRQYVSDGGDLEAGRRTKGKTPLFHAMDLEKRKSFEELLSLGASPNTICRRGRTVTCPLHWAAMVEESYWLERLLEHGGDVNLELVRGNRVDLPLSCALPQRASLKNVKLLVEHGADVNAVVESPDRTALMKASANAGWWKVLYLLEQGADYEKGGYSPRTFASLMQKMSEKVQLNSTVRQDPGFEEVVQWLTDRGADPERARWDGTKWRYDRQP